MSSSTNIDRCARAAAVVLRRSPSGVITDVDGTISEIASRPWDAVVAPEAVELLSRFVGMLPMVAVLSGRPVEELRAMLGLEGLVYVGNHGLEWWEDGRPTIAKDARPFVPFIAATAQCLRDDLRLPGVLVEDKGATASVHFRLAANPSEARTAVLRAIASCPAARDLRLSEGRMVVDILPPIPADKGTAARHLVRSQGLVGVVYLGDDSTDLDGFRALRGLGGPGQVESLRIAVASSEAPAELLEEADCIVDGVDEVLALLCATAGELQDSRYGS